MQHTQSSQKYIPSPLLNTDYLLYHTDTVLTSSLEVLRIWCRLNSVKLNFVKTGLKFEFGVNLQSFSVVSNCWTGLDRWTGLWTGLLDWITGLDSEQRCQTSMHGRLHV